MISIQKFKGQGMHIPHFHASGGEGWCLLGANTSGVDYFADTIAEPAAGAAAVEWTVPQSIGVLTFRRQQALFEEELRRDDTDFLQRIDPGTPAAAFITDIDRYCDLIAVCNMTGSLHKGYRQLSSGQSRKLCLLSEISRGVRCLVVQNPYDGIDPESCRDLDRLFASLLDQGMLVIVTMNNSIDLPSWCTHLGGFSSESIIMQGKREEVVTLLPRVFEETCPELEVSVAEMERERLLSRDDTPDSALIQLVDGFASYDGQPVFSGINLTVHDGEHTLITGANGSGKSTLVQLITGDHPLCYRNQLTLFGMQRGSGESVWDIKRHLGLVSPDLHRNHHIPGSSLQVVLSGLFDSIGLYRKPTRAQQQLAHRWLRRVGMTDMAKKPFRQLTYAQQRLLLIARALIKVPRLLILDEPTQGLDQANRNGLLDLLEQVAADRLCTLLYVSHREDEYRSFFQQHLVMGRDS